MGSIYSSLQIPQNKLRHHGVPVFYLGRVCQAVALGWVDHQVELFIGLLERVDELGGVLHVDVVVHGAVDEEQAA